MLKEDKQNDISLYNIGFLYENGYGVKQDCIKAMEYYQKSAEKGNSDVLYNIGTFYKKGYGVKRDYPKAMEDYKKSLTLKSEQNHNDL